MELMKAVLPVAVTGIVAVIMILILKNSREAICENVYGRGTQPWDMSGCSTWVCPWLGLPCLCDSVLYAAGIHYWDAD